MSVIYSLLIGKRRKEKAQNINVTSLRTLNKAVSSLLQVVDVDKDDDDDGWHVLSTYSKTDVALYTFSHLFLLMSL